MKRIFNKHITWILVLFLATTLNSCVKDDEVSITEANRYTSEDITSYAELFKVFWTVMNQRYNYFYEQKNNKDRMDWNAIYTEYYPKFAALKSYNADGFTVEQIVTDARLANQYFTDIIDPIIDRHFTFSYCLPNRLAGKYWLFFYYEGGMKTKNAFFYEFDDRFNYMKDLLGDNYIEGNYKDEKMGVNLIYQMGSLRTNPDIYYFTYNEFSLYLGTKINFSSNKYLNLDAGFNQSLLTATEIENNSQLAAIKNEKLRKELKDLTLNILNAYNSFIRSNEAEIKIFNKNVNAFKNTETEVVTTAFVDNAKKILENFLLVPNYLDEKEYSTLRTKESDPYIDWFIEQMNSYTNAYKFDTFIKDTKDFINKAPVYQNFFDPLHKGQIKKIIIDLRGNGGGMVVDINYFTNRFVTKNTVWGYQRTKEGNGKFNYTPWVPIKTSPHQFNIPTNIPMTVLTDKRVLSMSEISTLIWKTQGAISIGDYSSGGTSGLTDNSDQFNGGSQDKIGFIDKDENGNSLYKLSFYIPIMATKDVNGNVIEGIGIKPDIYVAPPSEEEVNQMKNTPKTHIDRTLKEAIKYLSSK
ncbi:S41 family peptidase [Flavobacterium poyangense]|uniref:S41 family peptidase n=1 Tax=Flavobacterium poyangense TaxID=2204302 RepID=UPI00141EF81B|nr:S41 family peptidase [Flavobacterium sp. JXAS1]